MVGLGVARVAGLVLPAARRAVRVANAVDYQFESWRPGHQVDDYRTFFLFSNEAYARAFAEANAAILRAPRKRALVAGE
jgi:hypothetical protein